MLPQKIAGVGPLEKLYASDKTGIRGNSKIYSRLFDLEGFSGLVVTSIQSGPVAGWRRLLKK